MIEKHQYFLNFRANSLVNLKFSLFISKAARFSASWLLQYCVLPEEGKTNGLFCMNWSKISIIIATSTAANGDNQMALLAASACFLAVIGRGLVVADWLCLHLTSFFV